MIPRRNLFERCCRVMDGFVPTKEDVQKIIEMNDKAPFFFPYLRLREDSEIPTVSDFLSIGKRNWNVEGLALTGLAFHYIYFFMHSLFVDSHVFCVTDIPHLKPEDLTWQVTVQYEQFDR